MRRQGKCTCGSVEIAIDMDPFLIYRCHCSHCRAFATKPTGPSNANVTTTTTTSDNTVSSSSSTPTTTTMITTELYHEAAYTFRWNVCLIKGQDMLDYTETTDDTGFYAMSRGKCRQCYDPIVEWCYRLGYPLCMVSCKPFESSSPSQRLIPDTNIYYDSGYQLGTNGMKKTTYSDWSSLFYEYYIILTVAIPSLPYSIYAYLTRDPTTTKTTSKPNKAD